MTLILAVELMSVQYFFLKKYPHTIEMDESVVGNI